MCTCPLSVSPSVCPSMHLKTEFLPVFDIFWQLLTVFDSFWQLLTAFDNFWQFLTAFVSCWLKFWMIVDNTSINPLCISWPHKCLLVQVPGSGGASELPGLQDHHQRQAGHLPDLADPDVVSDPGVVGTQPPPPPVTWVQSNTSFWLVNISHVTSILASDWSRE